MGGFTCVDVTHTIPEKTCIHVYIYFTRHPKNTSDSGKMFEECALIKYFSSLVSLRTHLVERESFDVVELL